MINGTIYTAGLQDQDIHAAIFGWHAWHGCWKYSLAI